MILVALLYAILAATFILAKHALAYAQPCFLIGFRMTLAGTLLLGFSWVRGSFTLNCQDWWLLVRVALFHVYFSFILEFWALQYLAALKTTLIYSLTPFIAALLSYILLKERLSTSKIMGILIGLCGMVPIFMVSDGAVGELFKITVPDVVLLGAVISGAYAWFLVKELLNKGYSLVVVNGVAMLLGGLLSFGTSAIFETAPMVSDWSQFLLWVGALILVSNIVVYNFYGWLLGRYSITFLTFAGFLCPSFAMLYDWLLLGGHLSMHTVISLVLVTIGLYIFYRQELFKHRA